MNESKERQNDLSCTESLCDLARMLPCASQALEHNSSGTELQVHTSSLVESRSRFASTVFLFFENLPLPRRSVVLHKQALLSHLIVCNAGPIPLFFSVFMQKCLTIFGLALLCFGKEKLRHTYLPHVSFVTNTVLHTRRLCSHGRLFHILPPTYERDRTTR